MEIDIEIVCIFLFIGLLYIRGYFLKRKNRSKAKRLFVKFLEYFEDYELEVLKAFDEYLISNKILIYKNGNSKIIEKNKFIEADIKEAFVVIKSKLSDQIKEKLYHHKNVNIEYLKLLINIFDDSNNKYKLNFVNKKIEVLAIDVAIENNYSYDKKKHNIGIGAEFIALVAFQNEVLLGYVYPEGNYDHMKQLLKLRKKNPDLSFEEFLIEFDY